MYKITLVAELVKRLLAPGCLIQAVVGPRPSGKTTLVTQVLSDIGIPSLYVSADESMLKDAAWIETQWERARVRIREVRKPFVLVFDEIQKIDGWPEMVKKMWDSDVRSGSGLRVVILGSAPLLMHRGLAESLAGRFEVVRSTHWTFVEMRDAFGWDWESFVYYGGYPGSAGLISDSVRWANYVKDSLIEPTISKDILMMTRVDKPALLRKMFELGCLYSGQILSYQKMLGQLQDSGNTVTLAHYLNLLQSAGMVAGLQKYSGQKVRQRGSSPKLQVMNTALLTALRGLSFDETKANPDVWGRLVESAVGADLIGKTSGTGMELFYWNSGSSEVDFVLCKGKTVVAIEVKSGRSRPSLPGMAAFSKEYEVSKRLLIGEGGIPIREFMEAPVGVFID